MNLVQSVAPVSLREEEMIKRGVKETLRSCLCLAMLLSVIYC